MATIVMILDLFNKVVSLVCEGWSWWWDGITENYVTKAVVTLLVAILVISWYTWLGKRSMNGKPPLPPGPRGLPVVGYLPFLEADLHRYFAKLAQVYGPIMKLQLGNKLCVVLSSSSLAKEVLKDHDAVFANHDAPVAGLAVTYGGLDIVWSPNGPYWRMLRKVCVREMMSNTSLDACYSLRQQEVREMVRDVYNMTGKPINIAEQAFITTLNVIMNMLWGGTLQGEERSSVGVEFQKVVGDIIELLGKPNISDLFPVLARFDIQGIERQTKEKLSWFDRIFESVIDKRLKMDRACGDDTYKNNKSKDFLQFLLERKQGDDKESLTMIQLKALFMDVIVGGTDTSSTTVEWAMAEMMHNPEIMRKVQEELQLVVGMNDMVEESHLPKLCYLDAVVKETLRLHSALPLLVPHRPSLSCTVGGYTIPKDSRVFFNVWAIHRDPEAWENPLEFQPERFLSDTGKGDYTGNNFNYLPFGSGRRICAGVPLAERMLLYMTASLLHSFDWRLPEGTKLDLSEKFGLVLKKTMPLIAIPTPRLSKLDHYT